MLLEKATGRRKHVKECLIIPNMEIKIVLNTIKRKVEGKDNG
jgi:hypothetical protein